MRRVTVDEALAGVDPFDGEPLVVLDDPPTDGPAGDTLAELLAGVPAVVVGLDVAAPDDAALRRIARVVDEHREAAVALAVLLRTGHRRSITDGLVAESATYSSLQGGADHRRWLAGRPAPPSRAAAGEVVRLERAGDTLRITLDRPEVHNAYSAAMRDQLINALAVGEADPDLRVELTGAGPSFCAGGDLDEFGTGPDPAEAHRLRLRRSAAAAMARVADRVTVLLHGACVGAGIELPAYAGRIVADPGARFRLPEVSMGLVPGAGGTVSIPRRIGRTRTAWLALTGRPIDAATALDWGLVDEVAPVRGAASPHQ